MLNRVVLVGRLTKDPEYRTTPSGVSVATFTLAVNRTFTNAQGNAKLISLIVLSSEDKLKMLITTYLKVA